MSAASVEAVDGTAPPSMRDPYLATQEWQGDFNSLRGERKYRTYKPGVVFDVAHEPAHDRQNLKYTILERNFLLFLSNRESANTG
ncbi:hypothetical protein MPER_07721 [Moniliophthora perniciosa FA553]|nr:hypothetical protein MPER_07721 [Moniliophthora perniciosa FA553]